MSLLWLRVAGCFYALAAQAVLPAALYNRPARRRLAIPAAIGGALFHFVAVTEMLVAAHHALPVETHETLSFLGLLFSVGFLLLSARYKTVSFGIFLLPIAILLTLVPAFRPGSETIAYPYLRTGWLFLHIALLLAAYAALLVSLLASLLYLVQERRLKQKRIAAPSGIWLRLPPLETTDSIALRSLLFGLPCMTFGLLIGSVIALQTVGPAFFADWKVLLSLAMWLAYMTMIYIRQHLGLRGRRAVYMSSFAFLFVLAVWAANQFSAVHRFNTP